MTLPHWLPIPSEQMSHRKVRILGKRLRKYDRVAAVELAAGLMTMPTLQANWFRLELLPHLLVAYCGVTFR